MGSRSSSSASSSTTNQQDNRIIAGDGAFVVGPDGTYQSTIDNSIGVTSTNSTSTSNSGNTTISDSGNWDWNTSNSTTSNDDNSLNVTTSTSNSTTDSGNWNWNTSNTSTTTNSGGNWDWNTSNTTSTDSHDTYTLSDSGALATAQAISATNAEFLGLAAETQSETLQFVAQMSADQLAATGDSMTEMFTYGADQNRQAWESTLAASQGLIGQMLGQAAATTASAKEIANAAISSFMPTDNKNADTARYALYAGLAFLAYKALK